MKEQSYDEVVIPTLPTRISRWVKRDLPQRGGAARRPCDRGDRAPGGGDDGAVDGPAVAVSGQSR